MKTIEARKRDIVIRIADWTRTNDAPTYDVEVYLSGNYIGECSGSFPKNKKRDAIAFAREQLLKLADPKEYKRLKTIAKLTCDNEYV